MTKRRSVFRPCIDLHGGQVKQIVGGTLSDTNPNDLKTNFVSQKPPAEFARLYKDNFLEGGHVIKLGPGNDEAAKEALAAWPGGLQIGGGITDKNATEWLNAGASKVYYFSIQISFANICMQVIVTSYLFPESKFSLAKLEAISTTVGKDRLVVDVR
ncbi:hypothetical protein HHX47_DHR5000719 [Lentinula edodes]|nr:hypothetical protein HHX47_DHR5000719 [Lentinula edodes]